MQRLARVRFYHLRRAFLTPTRHVQPSASEKCVREYFCEATCSVSVSKMLSLKDMESSEHRGDLDPIRPPSAI